VINRIRLGQLGQDRCPAADPSEDHRLPAGIADADAADLLAMWGSSGAAIPADAGCNGDHQLQPLSALANTGREPS
jgi:hypothetical protein